MWFYGNDREDIRETRCDGEGDEARSASFIDLIMDDFII
jgi:hypothetical protein